MFLFQLPYLPEFIIEMNDFKMLGPAFKVLADLITIMEFQWNPRGGSSLHCFQVELEFGNAGFCGGRKTGVPGEKPLEQGREPTTNSTHI